jgi:hypothetical protein
VHLSVAKGILHYKVPHVSIKRPQSEDVCMLYTPDLLHNFLHQSPCYGMLRFSSCVHYSTLQVSCHGCYAFYTSHLLCASIVTPLLVVNTHGPGISNGPMPSRKQTHRVNGGS